MRLRALRRLGEKTERHGSTEKRAELQGLRSLWPVEGTVDLCCCGLQRNFYAGTAVAKRRDFPGQSIGPRGPEARAVAPRRVESGAAC